MLFLLNVFAITHTQTNPHEFSSNFSILYLIFPDQIITYSYDCQTQMSTHNTHASHASKTLVWGNPFHKSLAGVRTWATISSCYIKHILILDGKHILQFSISRSCRNQPKVIVSSYSKRNRFSTCKWWGLDYPLLFKSIYLSRYQSIKM